jgi:hypothetical protein
MHFEGRHVPVLLSAVPMLWVLMLYAPLLSALF